MERTETLGDRLLYLRECTCMTQRQVADHLHITPAAVSHWESGSWMPTPYRIAALAKLFNVTTDYLISGNKTA